SLPVAETESGGTVVTESDSDVLVEGGGSRFLSASVATPTWAQVVVGTASDTPTTMATKLAAAINADTILSTWATATSSGPVVTVTSIAGTPLVVNSYAGNGGTRIQELGRRSRELQISLWARSIEDRDTVGDQIDAMLSQMEVNYGAYPNGLLFSDG